MKNVLIFSYFMIFALSSRAFAHDHSGHGLENAPTKPLLGNSIYNLDSKWTDQDGKTSKISALRGKITVLAMTYTSCQAACPIITSNMQQIESQLHQDAKGKVQFALFSFDSKRDTPKKLKEYAQKRKLDLQYWRLYQGGQKEVQELAMVLGIKYKQDKGGDFDHSNVITLVDPEGQVRYQQVGLNVDNTKTLDQIKELLVKPPSK